ncbi:CmpA/NrtA family ABC transporter substrate-binding protein [Paracoccus spongiarum]|uniref:CmpA/NrtA family ABC transporter substrate-binding protein n=1 Tax=Paracoccus spongiarum TaxID=3064387 RepID=A0ABT9JAT0_9RHOB|nr:CmpA/NrtA family ABC transporter substrate-binding protein [Paracoccus sp. 2205BS29-5]MDP5306927.1 CmpA/NrtA family ABC transporter substrate-binding protein [Paracoccus sp. 2205BS29-5]
MSRAVDLSFIPLLDAAPLIVADRMGFAEEERLAIRLHRARTWSMLRDMLALGQVDAAQMLSAVPIAGRLGLGGAAVDFETALVLSLGGQVIGVSPALADDLRGAGLRIDFRDALAARDALLRARPAGLRFGVPFPFSMHAELLHLWLGDMPGLSTVTVPPPQIAEALLAGEIEAFCVGEPWGSSAVSQRLAELLLPGTAIWTAAPEKVLATRRGWFEANPDRGGALMRAVWRACRWLDQPESRATASEMLARDDALAIEPEVIERALSSRLLLSATGDGVDSPGFIAFHDGAANFPWRSQAAWIGRQMSQRLRLDADAAMRIAQSVWRPDLYRQHLGDVAVLPAASAKVEGACPQPILAGANRGTVLLGRNQFFDGRIFDLLPGG